MQTEQTYNELTGEALDNAFKLYQINNFCEDNQKLLKFITKCFGEEAVFVDFEIGAEYNDGNETSEEVLGANVLNANNVVIEAIPEYEEEVEDSFRDLLYDIDLHKHGVIYANKIPLKVIVPKFFTTNS